MLASDFDDIDCVNTPCIAQPKLNGFRAYWDGEVLASRTQKLWTEKKLPHIYEKLRVFSEKWPGVMLDGELYCHGMPLQEISKRCSGSNTHFDKEAVEFHVFDVISSDDTETRQKAIIGMGYTPFVPCARIEKLQDINPLLARFVECGFERMMLRELGFPYIHDRTPHLIKLKPWQYGTGRIVSYTPGEGKYENLCGALVVKSGNITFRVSGGLKDFQRADIAQHFSFYVGRDIEYKYRELSNSGKPLQPQIHRL